VRKSRKEQVPTLPMFIPDPFGREVSAVPSQSVEHVLDLEVVKERVERSLGLEVSPELLLQAARNVQVRQVEGDRIEQIRLGLCLN
jgi:hypothetical protein